MMRFVVGLDPRDGPQLGGRRDMCEGGFIHIVQSQKEACHMEVPKFRESYAGPKLQSDVHQGTPLHVRGHWASRFHVH